MNVTQQQLVRKDCARILGEHPQGLDAMRSGVLLITGGTGFMGTWLAEMAAYLNDRHGFELRLLLLSDQATLFKERVPHLAGRKDIQLIASNIVGVTELPQDVNWIVHAAADPDNRQHVLDPLGTIRVIARGTDMLLHAAAQLPNVQKIVHVSSGLVYGQQPLEMTGVAETYMGGLNCASPGQAYAEAKRLAETICAAYRTQMRLPIVTVRPFAFLGPYQLLDRPWAANSFIRDSLRGGPVRIQGDGQSIRSYMYPADMAWWILTILAEGKPGAVFNLGSPEGTTLMDLARKIAAALAQPIKIIPRVLGPNAPPATRLVPDVTFARETLQLDIRTDLDTAIRLGLQWYRELPEYGGAL